jgi:hypothetical protein
MGRYVVEEFFEPLDSSLGPGPTCYLLCSGSYEQQISIPWLSVREIKSCVVSRCEWRLNTATTATTLVFHVPAHRILFFPRPALQEKDTKARWGLIVEIAPLSPELEVSHKSQSRHVNRTWTS